jgi:hypothetical protein
MSFLTRLLSRFQMRHSMGRMMYRDDDHLLRDIGMTKDDLLTLMEQGCDNASPPKTKSGGDVSMCKTD